MFCYNARGKCYIYLFILTLQFPREIFHEGINLQLLFNFYQFLLSS